ncbi:hypothetical protein Tsubulata_039929 [Turnera subulata]|uniref:DUF4283 domain-containing protein n=1 Tax=Turnera subulata TaxID=218843 RepID=A0A9Q0FJ54_9ROSI|nr:hypothetical protein Tsubulata_039929 [Turnera subulata]
MDEKPLCLPLFRPFHPRPMLVFPRRPSLPTCAMLWMLTLLMWRQQPQTPRERAKAKATMVDLIHMADLEKVVTRGPWMVYDHYLTVRQWFPEFRLEKDHLVKTMAWVRLSRLPLQYYDDDLLTTFASAIGRPVKIDSNTSLATRALYARMCVEIDFGQPLVPQVHIQDEGFKVQYEGLQYHLSHLW